LPNSTLAFCTLNQPQLLSVWLYQIVNVNEPFCHTSLVVRLREDYFFPAVVLLGHNHFFFLGKINPFCVNLTGKLRIEELAAVLSKAALFIGHDTGTTHMASYLGVPTVGIYAAVGDINVWASKGGDVTVIRADMPCSPCYLRHIHECAFEHACITAITVDDVYRAAREMLSHHPRQ
jgi:ADP-heptose:LPS heptosyltransferase